MSVRYLKNQNQSWKKIRGRKSGLLLKKHCKIIEDRGDSAIRELSKKFDGYSPKSFKLNSSEIEALSNRYRPVIWMILSLPKNRLKIRSSTTFCSFRY